MEKINKTPLRGVCVHPIPNHQQLGVFWFVPLPLYTPGFAPVRVVAFENVCSSMLHHFKFMNICLRIWAAP